MTIRTAPGINGEPILLGVFCVTCGQESMPMRNGTCGFCDRKLVTADGREVYRPVPPKRVGVYRNWTRSELITAIRKFDRDHGYPPILKDWETSGDWPNVGTIKRQFGSWANAIEAAGFERPRRGTQNMRRVIARGSRAGSLPGAEGAEAESDGGLASALLERISA